MNYKDKFNLTGTDQQIQIVKTALDKIYYPWETIHMPSPLTEIGWMDLNNGMFRMHGDEHGHDGEKPEPLMGKLNGRKYILGVFYPGSGRIYIDNELVYHPSQAQATVSAEIAHAVDEFKPLTDEQRTAIMRLMHGGGTDDHTWWEKVDYGVEYFSLVGESFMQAFTIAYSDMPFGNTADFDHALRYEDIPAFRKIIGIERTDTTNVQPAPVQYKVFKGSKIYHRLTHYPNRAGIIINSSSGYTRCKVCKP